MKLCSESVFVDKKSSPEKPSKTFQKNTYFEKSPITNADYILDGSKNLFTADVRDSLEFGGNCDINNEKLPVIRAMNSQGSDTVFSSSSQSHDSFDLNNAITSSSPISDSAIQISSQSLDSDVSQISEKPNASPTNSRGKLKMIVNSQESVIAVPLEDENFIESCNTLNAQSPCHKKCLSDSSKGIISFYDKTIQETNDLSLKSIIGSSVFTLSYKPPSRNDVLNNLLNYGLSIEKDLMPFYGDPRDMSSSKEVGVEIVKLPSHRLSELEEYVGDMGSALEDSTKILKEKSDAKIPNISSHSEIIIAPAKKPPSINDAVIWKRTSKKSTRISPSKENVKDALELAIFGGSQNESQSLNLTPCTPCSTQKSSEDSRNDLFAAHSTPAVIDQSVFSPSVTPIQSTRNKSSGTFLPTIDENEESYPKSGSSAKTKVRVKLRWLFLNLIFNLLKINFYLKFDRDKLKAFSSDYSVLK